MKRVRAVQRGTEKRKRYCNCIYRENSVSEALEGANVRRVYDDPFFIQGDRYVLGIPGGFYEILRIG